MSYLGPDGVRSGADRRRRERFGWLYVALSQVSRAVMRSCGRDDLLNQVVRVLVEVGRFDMAFVGMHDPATRQLVPVARFGDALGYTDRITIYTDERPEGLGPAGHAFRSGEPFICNDFLNDPGMNLWQEAARESGWGASAGFPIHIGGSPEGILLVYARSPEAFGADEVELLGQVALDVAFGIEHFNGEERRKRAEAALTAKESQLRLAVESGAQGTFQMDQHSGAVVWGGHYERILGFEPGGFDGSRGAFEKCVHPEDLPGVRAAIAAARDNHGTVCHEFRIVCRDGTELWLSATGGFHYTESGRPDRMYGVFSDITERKTAEISRIRSEERLEQAIRVARIGFFEHDFTAGCTYWSPQLRTIHGWSQDEQASLKSYLEVSDPSDRSRIEEAIRRAEDPAGDGAFVLEQAIRRRDGSTGWTQTRGQVTFAGKEGSRRPLRIVGAVQDITEQKKAEAERLNLAALVEMSRDLIAIAALDGRIEYLNPAGVALLGLQSRADANGRNLCDCFEVSARGQLHETLCPEVMSGGFWNGESQLRSFATGEAIAADVTAFQLLGDDGERRFTATIARDIRARKLAEEHKAKLEERVLRAQEMEALGRMAAGVAHDFDNLLTVINGYSEWLLERLPARDPNRTSIGEIKKAGDLAAGLTRQLKAFSRGQVLQPRVVDLNQDLRGMRAMLERLSGNGVEVRLLFCAGTAEVNADPHQLERVIMNLAINARDAMPNGGLLTITTATVDCCSNQVGLNPCKGSGAYVRLSVSDTGTGIEPATLAHIFEPFFTTKEKGDGTGLGLSMVEGIVAQSGGCVEVESELGRGTTFHVYLPAVTSAAECVPLLTRGKTA